MLFHAGRTTLIDVLRDGDVYDVTTPPDKEELAELRQVMARPCELLLSV